MRFISYFFYLALLNFICCSPVWAVQKTQKKHDLETAVIVYELQKVPKYGGTEPLFVPYKTPEGLSDLKQSSELEEGLIRIAPSDKTKPTCCSKICLACGVVGVAGSGLITIGLVGVLGYYWLGFDKLF